MKGRRMTAGSSRAFFALSFGVLLLLGGCDPRGGSTPPLVKKQSWETFFNRGDSAAVAGLYAKDAQLVMSGEAPVRGREAIQAAITRMAQTGVKVRIDVERSAAAGKFAYFYGAYAVLLQRRVVERGTYLEVWQSYNGNWLIDLDVNATGTPVGMPPQH